MKKILFAASECVPFVKTGGLADVVGSLPFCFDKTEFDVRVMLPAYTMIPARYRSQLRDVLHFWSWFNGRDRYVGVKELSYRGVTFYFIDNEDYFAGSSPYTDYRYDIEKFCFFSKAVLSVLPSLGFRPDVIHCHDWHTGLVPVYLKNEFAADPFYSGIRSVMTVHNLKFQGLLTVPEMMSVTGLPQELFTIDRLRTGGDGNMLKGGLVYADEITTVSLSYTEEVKTPAYGEGLEGLFRARSNHFRGILNGIDTQAYDPAADKAIIQTYDSGSYPLGKALCKAALQKELGLKEDPRPMLVGIVSRLTEQKGLDLVARILTELMGFNIQLVVLGTGEERFEALFRQGSERYPGRLAACLRYNEALAHRIYAGCDAFLMPSLFEPCGLSQLIALRYGAVPIVRETGGLRDTVVPFNRFTGEGSGFSFGLYNAETLLNTLSFALTTYQENRPGWEGLIRTGMSRDFSWTRSAREYEALYREL